MKYVRLLIGLSACLVFASPPARGESVQYEYDKAGRLVGAHLADAGVGVGYRYDAAGNLVERNVCSGACVIDAVCRAASDAKAGSACERCDPAQSRTAWSPAPAGTPCDDGNGETSGDACNASGACVGNEKGCGCGLADTEGPSVVGIVGIALFVAFVAFRRQQGRVRGSRRRHTRAPIRSTLGAAILAALGATLPRAADAHQFDKTQLVLVGPGATGTFTVSDSTGCSANMTAASANSAIATVAPTGGAGVSVTFTVTAVAIGSTWITVQWSGIGQNCTDVGAGNVTVKVVATASAANAPDEGNSGDPVSTATGELFFDEPADLDLGGPMPLVFSRTYASQLERDGNATSALGRNWLHAFDWKLTNETTAVTVVSARGEVISLAASAGVYTLTSAARAPYQLVASGSDFILGDPRNDRLYTFNLNGYLTKIEDGLGNAHTLTYTSGRLASVADGLGRTLTFTYDGSNRLTQVSDGTRAVGFGYSSGNLASVTDALGGVVNYEYTTAGGIAGLLVRKVRPRGNAPFVQAYDDAGRVTTQTDALGYATTFAFNDAGAVVTDAIGGTERHVHVGRRLVEFVDTLDASIALGYDDAGRRAAATDRAGQTTSFTRHALSGKVASMRLADGTTINFTYESRTASGITLWHLKEIQYPDGTRETFTVTNGNISALVDRGGATWAFTHNARGQMLTMTTPLGGVFTWTYNADGTVATLRDAANNVTTYTYDALRRVTGVANADSTARSYAYDALDRLTSLTDERTQTATFAYDTNGNLTTRIDALDASTTFTYDAMDRLTSVADPQGGVASRTYDALGRPAVLIDRAGLGTAISYDARGFTASLRGPAPATDGGVDGGALWQFLRGAEGEWLGEIDPLGRVTTMTTDAVGRLTAMRGPSDAGFQLAYDSMSRLTTVVEPGDGGASRFTYDAGGFLERVELPNGVAIALGRNAGGALTALTDPNGAIWTRGFDSAGRVTSETDPHGRAMSYSYDARNRVSVATFPSSLGTLTYTYDGLGNVTRKLYSDSTDVSFAYDALGRLTSASGVSLGYDARGGITSSNGIAVTRDTAGRIATVTLAPGKAVTYAYDDRNLVASVADWVGGTTTFAYDAARRLTSLARPNGVATTYGYDVDGRLSALTETFDGGVVSAIALTRDALGRVVAAERTAPLAATPPQGAATWSYDIASQIDGGTSDPLGRITTLSGLGYAWDLASRLKSMNDGGTAVTYTHDAFGRRTARAENGVTESYVWSYAFANPTVAIIKDGGADLRYAVHAPNGLLLHTVEAAGNTRRFFHFDEMGNTLFRTDDTGATTDRYAYGPYGEAWGEDAPGTSLFTYGGAFGVMRDATDRRHAMGVRVYDPETARFLTRDPRPRSMSPNEANPYVYARMNPLLYNDPHGTNARVNQSGVHTDISVDVWEGDVIVGVFTVSFAAKGYTGKFGGIGEAFSTVIGGTQSQFSVSFQPGQSVGTAGSNSQIIVPGSRAQDQRMADAMLRAIGEYNGANAGQLPISLIRNMQQTQGKGAKRSVNFVRDGAGDWSTYRAVTTSCNAFTDVMLDVYFGENWGGLFFEGDGLVSELRTYLDDGYKRAQERQREAQRRYYETHLEARVSTVDGNLIVFYIMR